MTKKNKVSTKYTGMFTIIGFHNHKYENIDQFPTLKEADEMVREYKNDDVLKGYDFVIERRLLNGSSIVWMKHLDPVKYAYMKNKDYSKPLGEE